MRVVELSGRQWRSKSDVYAALISALDGPNDYGRNINALLELIVWDHGKPVEPYTLRISDVANLAMEVRQEVNYIQQALREARAECLVRNGYDVEANIEIAS